MGVYIRRFLFDPGNTVLLNIESVNILDLEPPSTISGIGTGTVLIVGEFENGPFATPTQVASATDMVTNFGSLGYTYGGIPCQNPCAVSRNADGAIAAENWNGNGFIQLNGKQFASLVLCRVDTSVGAAQFTPRAYITGAAAFRFALSAGQVLALDVGAGAQTATFNATAAVMTSVPNQALSGTVSVTQSNANITFSVAQTLPAGTALVFASQPGVVYVLLNAIVAATAGTLTAVYTGTTNAATTTLAQTYGVNNGDTVTLGYDGAPNIVVTFLTGDATQAGVIARINQYLGFSFAAASGGVFTMTSRQLGSQAQVRVVASSTPGVLTALGLTVNTVFGTGNVANIAAVTVPEIAGVVQAAIANTLVEVDQNGALRISNTLGTASSIIQVLAATTATALGFTTGQLGTYLGVGAVLGLAGAFPVANSGTITLAIDDNLPSKPVNQGQPFIVTITAAQTAAQIITAINTAAGKTVAYADGTQILLVGTAPGGRVNIVGASAANVLSQLGFSPGITTGTGLPSGVLPAGTVVQNTAATTVFVTMQDIVFGSSGVLIGGVTQTTMGPWLVKIRHATDNGTGVSAGAGTVLVVPTPPLIISVNVTNPQATSAALTDSQIDAQYVAAINATTDINTVAKVVNIIYSARQSNTVRRALRTNALNASAGGCFGRMAFIRTPLGTTKATALSVTADPGVGAYRDQRVVYCFPQVSSFVPLIAKVGVAGGTGFTASGNIDIGADGFLASICSQLPPEENPGQDTAFASAVVALESSPNAQGFTMQDYINFKAAGICAIRIDSGVAAFQSGVTSVDPSLNPGLVPIARRRMADFIQDSIAQRSRAFGKRLSTRSRRKALEQEIRSFLDQLLNKDNPNGQRIAGYTVDANSANTPTTLGQGLFRIIVSVRTLASMDAIVLQTTIGTQVQVTEQLPANAA